VIRKGWKKKRKLTRDEYAKKCHVSKMAISKAIRKGSVTEDDQGRVDTADPVNREYLQTDHHVMKRAKRKPKEKRKDDPKASRAAESKRRAKKNERKIDAEIRIKEEQANYHVQRRARELGLLVERAKVEQMMGAFGPELKVRLLDLPRRISVHLFSLARSKGATPMAIEGFLSKELSEAIIACKEKARAVGLGTLGI
jgi:hypothetical protein